MNVYSEIQQIKSLIRKYVPILQKLYTLQRLQTPEEVREILSGIYGFHRFYYRTTDDKIF